MLEVARLIETKKYAGDDDDEEEKNDVNMFSRELEQFECLPSARIEVTIRGKILCFGEKKAGDGENGEISFSTNENIVKMKFLSHAIFSDFAFSQGQDISLEFEWMIGDADGIISEQNGIFIWRTPI